MAVAAFFIINPLLPDSFDVPGAWSVLDIFMVIGLAPALVFSYAAKREQDAGGPDSSATRRYVDVNVVFYLTAAVAILFLHNWFSLLALGTDSLEGNHQAWVIWAFVDVALPLTFCALGVRLWRENSQR